MKIINQANLKDKRILVRVDFNVPMDGNQHITDDKRIREALATIQYIRNQGGAVILMSHLGRPKKGFEQKYSLEPVHNHLAELLNINVLFVKDCISKSAQEVCKNLSNGDVVMLENLRFYPEEEKGDAVFAELLASLADIYCNDAFGTAHRPHASTTIVAQYFKEKYAGFLIEQELKNANQLLNNPQKPFLLITGGAKVSDKLPILNNLLSKVNTIFIGGGMAYTFLVATGCKIGSSKVEIDQIDNAKHILEQAKKLNVEIILPIDSLAADEISISARTEVVNNQHIQDGWAGLDIGEKAIQQAQQAISNAKTIFWNGPMGVFEIKTFAKGTLAVAQALADATKNGAYTLVGGGDSAAAIEQAKLANKVSFVSTGGGALLEYLEGKTLPGIAALN